MYTQMHTTREYILLYNIHLIIILREQYAYSRVYNVHATVIRPTREYHTYYLFIEVMYYAQFAYSTSRSQESTLESYESYIMYVCCVLCVRTYVCILCMYHTSSYSNSSSTSKYYYGRRTHTVLCIIFCILLASQYAYESNYYARMIHGGWLPLACFGILSILGVIPRKLGLQPYPIYELRIIIRLLCIHFVRRPHFNSLFSLEPPLYENPSFASFPMLPSENWEERVDLV